MFTKSFKKLEGVRSLKKKVEEDEFITSDEDEAFEKKKNFKKHIPVSDILTSDEDESISEDKVLEKVSKKNKKKVPGSSSSEDASLEEVPLHVRLSKFNAMLEEPPKEEPEVRVHFGLSIEGINVEMPVRPYPCQKSVITAIINGCRSQQHCLLESPTGSGKTLALLCGSLAWQSDYAKKLFEPEKKEGKKSCDETAGTCQMDDDFNFDELDWSDDNFSGSSDFASQRKPKIFYGSRTHKQIEQVVKEFKKTCYGDKPMTILSSREYTCIQDTDRDKNQLCSELLDPSKKCGCPYYTEDNKFRIGSHSGLYSHGIEGAWDIEDLVLIGKDVGACPYFAARSLMTSADIIFCPYNYIIDPAIRESMQLDINGSIIILDEAHNIENICRDCGSISLGVEVIESIIKECETLNQIAVIQNATHETHYANIIEQFFEKLLRFVEHAQLKPQINSDSLNSDQWTGADFVNILDISKSITSTEIDRFKSAARDASTMYNSAKELLRTGKKTPPTLPHEIVRLVEKTLFAFNMVTSGQYASDYRIVVRQVFQGYKQEKSLEFMCMNPGVIFVPICDKARTVILASGTLAPTRSYQGELGVKFPFTIQADHVTPQEQVFIKCVPKGPGGTSLKATYQNVNTWGFQDDLGAVLMTVCEAVPHGILMFFSSYAVMGTLLKRWKTNGVWNKLVRVKEIFQETRGSADVNSMMDNYRKAIDNTSAGPVGTLTGALLFAVFRGKVAEGIDFSDNEARCVLTVGIPYAVRNEPATDMKFQYNDLNRKKGLLSGHDWYTIQAFRALNQALGRAIRHQNDWGAIILVDERFLEVRNMSLLPTWVRTMWIRQSKMDTDLRQLLKCFVAKQIKRERGKHRQLC